MSNANIFAAEMVSAFRRTEIARREQQLRFRASRARRVARGSLAR
jgi:hypothetical protein